MGRLFRVDYAKIGEVEKTPQGGLKIPAFLTRTGVFEYAAPDGSTIREYRPPEEVFHADSLALLRGAPIALDHPPEQIGPKNFRTFTVGHVADDVRKESDKVGATLFIQDAQAIKSVEAGRRELSCGYHCDVDETPGTTPDGESYDRVQRNIQYNHLALVSTGRAGPDVRLRLDSIGNALIKETPVEKIELIDGVEYAVGSDTHKAARLRLDASMKTAAQALETLQAERDAATARADAAEAKRNETLEKVKALLTPERLDQAVRRRTAVVEKARLVLGAEFKVDGLTNIQIKSEAVKKQYPTLRLDGKSKDYVGGLFKSIAAAPAKEERADKAMTLRAAVTAIPEHLRAAPGLPLQTGHRSLEQVRADAVSDSEERSTRPLALSKRDKYKELSNTPMLQGSQIETMK